MDQDNPKGKLQDRLGAWLARPMPAISQIDTISGYATLGSTVGQVRKENQDKLIAARLRPASRLGRSIFVFAVCDGMGGMEDGEFAARTALSTFIATLTAVDHQPLDMRLVDAAHAANNAVHKALAERGGSTLTAVAIELSPNPQVTTLHVGDSRLYQFLSDGRLKQITVDDTLAGQVGRPLSSWEHDIPGRAGLLQYIGMGDGIEPHVSRLDISTGSRYLLLATDGAYSIGDNLVSSILEHADSPSKAVQRLLRVADWTGGRDNASVVLIDLNALLPVRTARESALSGIEAYDTQGQFDFWWSPSEPSDGSAPARHGWHNPNLTPRDEKHGLGKPPKKKAAKKKNEVNDIRQNKTDEADDEAAVEAAKPQLKINFSDE